MRFFNQILAVRSVLFVIIFQLAFPLSFVRAATGDLPPQIGQESSPTLGEMKFWDEYLDHLKNTPDGQFPEIVDNFGLTKQRLFVDVDGQRKEYDLHKIDLHRPVISGDQRKLKFSLDLERRELFYTRGVEVRGNPEVRIMGYDFVAFANDLRGEFLIALTASGEIYAIDLFTAQKLAFNADMPIVKVGQLTDFRTISPSIEFSTIAREAPDNLDNIQTISDDPNYLASGVLQAGDVVIRNINGTPVGWVERDKILANLQKGLFHFVSECQVANPDFTKEKALLELEQRFSGLAQSEATSFYRGATQSLTTEAIINIKNAAGDAFWERLAGVGSAVGISNDILKVRHRFTLQEWKQANQEITAAAEANQRSVDEQFQGFLERKYTAQGEAIKPARTGFLHKMRNLVTLKGTQNLAYKIGTSPVLWVSAGLVAADQFLFQGHILSALSHYSYQMIYPDIWNRDALRVPLAVSILLQSMQIPAIYFLAVAVTKFFQKQDLGIANGQGSFGERLGRAHNKIVNVLMSASLKSMAVFQAPILYGTAWLARQKNLFRSLNRGHFSREALNMPWTSSEQLAQRATTLEEQIKRKTRLAAYARTVAYLVAAEKTGVDPVTLLHSPESISELKEFEDYENQWELLASEIYDGLLKSNHEAMVVDFSQANAEDVKTFRDDLIKHFDEARAAAQKLSQSGISGKVSRLVAKHRMKWRQLTQKTIPELVNEVFGMKMFETLWHSKPDEFVSQSAFRQFVIDYGFAIPLQMLWGPRADLSHPENLGVTESFPYISGPLQASNQEQVLVYLVRAPAEQHLVFSATPAMFEGTDPYSPADAVKIDISNESSESAGIGMWRWLKSSAQLRKARYFDYMARRYSRILKMTQARVGMGAPMRHWLGGKNWSVALSGQLYATVIGMWAYAWPWVPLTRAQQIYDGDVKAKYAQFKNNQTILAQSLRLGQSTLAEESAAQLRTLYKESHRTIQFALKQELKTFAGGKSSIDELAPEQVLEMTQILPPVPKDTSSFVMFFTTWLFGAIPTTVLANVMETVIYSDGFSQHPGQYVLTALGIGAGLQAAMHFGQHMMDRVFKRIDVWKAQKAKSCQAALISGTQKH